MKFPPVTCSRRGRSQPPPSSWSCSSWPRRPRWRGRGGGPRSRGRPVSCSLSRVTCHVSARHIFTWRVSPTNCGHPSARRQFPQQRNSSQQQRICSGCAVVQAPHHLFRFSQPSSTCCHVLAKLQRIGSAETYIWVLKL